MAARYSIEMANELRRKYDNGKTTSQLAIEYKIAKATVCRQIRRAGGTIRTSEQHARRSSARGLLAWLDS